MESPYKEILIFVFGGGLITAIIAISKEVRERVSEKRKAKAAAADQHLSNAVEMQRLENESDDAAWQRLSMMLKISQTEESRLRTELAIATQNSSLSSVTVTQWYKSYRELGIKIDRLETAIFNEAAKPDLLARIEDLKNKYDELGEKMP